MTSTATSRPLEANLSDEDVRQFLFLEARLQDEHEYDAWEALWDDEALYWVPAGSDDADPATQVSYVYDNRARIASRIRQLNTGRRHSQAPASRMRRVISNIEIERKPNAIIRTHANFMLVESRRGQMTLWAGRTIMDLSAASGTTKLRMKKVLLVNNDQPLSNMAFLI